MPAQAGSTGWEKLKEERNRGGRGHFRAEGGRPRGWIGSRIQVSPVFNCGAVCAMQFVRLIFYFLSNLLCELFVEQQYINTVD